MAMMGKLNLIVLPLSLITSMLIVSELYSSPSANQPIPVPGQILIVATGGIVNSSEWQEVYDLRPF
jgi:hypothetical protein